MIFNTIGPEGQGGGAGLTLLWTNPSPASTFGHTTINLDLSNYNFIAIKYRMNATSQTVYDLRFYKVGDASFVRQLLNSGKNLMQRYREVIISATGIEFSECTDITQGSNSVTNNDGNIPIEIYAQ